MDEFKRNQIPAFGNWDYSDGLPITQYFESARQAGLLRYSCGERDLYGGEELLFSDHHHVHHDLRMKPAITVVSRRKTKGATGEKRFSQVSKEHKKQGRVYDLTEPARQQNNYSGPTPREVVVLHAPPSPPQRAPKAVDEDLYKIPPELLYKQPKRKRVFGFFSCLVPTCAA